MGFNPGVQQPATNFETISATTGGEEKNENGDSVPERREYVRVRYEYEWPPIGGWPATKVLYATTSYTVQPVTPVVWPVPRGVDSTRWNNPKVCDCDFDDVDTTTQRDGWTSLGYPPCSCPYPNVECVYPKDWDGNIWDMLGGMDGWTNLGGIDGFLRIGRAPGVIILGGEKCHDTLRVLGGLDGLLGRGGIEAFVAYGGLAELETFIA